MEGLRALIADIPPITLRNFVLSKLDNPSQELADSLSLVLTGLQKPEMLHCLRCHKDYFEDDNTDTICQMPHDDEEERDSEDIYTARWPCCGYEVDTVSNLVFVKRMMLIEYG